MRWLQHVPHVKTMFGAVMALKGACSQAVHNKERCAALAECVRIAVLPIGAPISCRHQGCVGEH